MSFDQREKSCNAAVRFLTFVQGKRTRGTPNDSKEFIITKIKGSKSKLGDKEGTEREVMKDMMRCQGQDYHSPGP